MELQFEQLDYQHEAINAVVHLFQGEPNHEQTFALQSNFSPVVSNRQKFKRSAT